MISKIQLNAELRYLFIYNTGFVQFKYNINKSDNSLKTLKILKK